MNLTIFFAVIAFIGVAWYIVSGLMICNELQNRGEKIHYIFLNFLLPFYAQRYKKITKSESGKIGSLFYHWIIGINTALVFGIFAIISNSF